MYYQQIDDNSNARTSITTWLGYNHNPIANDGQFYDMENLTSDNYPLLSSRKERSLVKKGTSIRGVLFTDDILCYLEGDTLHYGTKNYDLSTLLSTKGSKDIQTLIRFGAYVLIFPEGIYVNLYKDDSGTMKSEYVSNVGLQIKYSICTSTGEDFENVVASDTAPENPADGEYWLNTGANSGLNIWYTSKSMWSPVATTYLRIEVPGAKLTDYFNKGDTIDLNTSVSNVNSGSQIQAIDDEYIVVIGLLEDCVTKTEETSSVWKLKILRKLPSLDYVCSDKNRIWGCHYGYADGEMVNEIYASKLGDFKNWYTYAGISTDSYAVSVGVPGKWTGCISFQGRPTFFKENAIFSVYGSYPSEYQIVQNDSRGVQDGSYRSLAIVNESLFYKSATDVCVYDGSSPTSISQALGRDTMYYSAIGGGCLNKYHLIMQDVKARNIYFVYDAQYGIWEKESSCPITYFTSTNNGQMYACTESKIYGLGSKDNLAYLNKYLDEEWVSWYAKTGMFGYDTPDSKYVSKLSIRAYIPTRSELRVYISYDGKPFEEVGTLRGNSDILSQNLDIRPPRCDHYQIEFMGHGDFKLYSMVTTIDSESEEYGNSY